MKLVIISNHSYSSNSRKASIHFIADEYARLGYSVYFVQVGRKTFIKSPANFLKLMVHNQKLVDTKDKIVGNEGSIVSLSVPSITAPYDLRSKIANSLTEPLLQAFGRQIPTYLARLIETADRIIVDSGNSVLFAPAARRLAPQSASIIYNAADIISNLTSRRSLAAAEWNIGNHVDVIRVPSSIMTDQFDTPRKCVVAPHGVDTEKFSIVHDNPYKIGTINCISVGSTLLDRKSLEMMADLRSDLTFHSFGTIKTPTTPSNLFDYGERPFIETVPYLVHADLSIAPYILTNKLRYMADTSLKIRQYSFCGLPILAPDTIEWNSDRVITYHPRDPSSIRSSIAAALTRGRDLGDDVPTWQACVQSIEGGVSLRD